MRDTVMRIWQRPSLLIMKRRNSHECEFRRSPEPQRGPVRDPAWVTPDAGRQSGLACRGAVARSSREEQRAEQRAEEKESPEESRTESRRAGSAAGRNP